MPILKKVRAEDWCMDKARHLATLHSRTYRYSDKPGGWGNGIVSGISIAAKCWDKQDCMPVNCERFTNKPMIYCLGTHSNQSVNKRLSLSSLSSLSTSFLTHFFFDAQPEDSWAGFLFLDDTAFPFLVRVEGPASVSSPNPGEFSLSSVGEWIGKEDYKTRLGY
jgi:hypothetical protein